MERERVNELFLGLILVVLLIILVVSFVGASNSNKTTNTITNSFNTYNYPENEDNGNLIVYPSQKNYEYTDYYDNYYLTHYNYDSEASHSRYYGLFDNEVNEYSVRVKNNNHEGNYYTVRFYLTDYRGNAKTESVTYYLNPHESRVFTYKNVFNSDKEYKYWNYRVIS